MPKGFHMGRSQFRPYTSEYPRIHAKAFKALPTGKLGSYTMDVDWYGEEHSEFELKERNNIRYLSFVINEREHQIALVHDDTSASKKLYISCPYCQKKRQHLHAFKNGYACRQCLGLHYPCQSERPQERLMRRIRKLRKELWGADFPFVYDMFEQCNDWPKPKWMRWKTFEAKRNHIIELEKRYWPLMMEEALRITGEISWQY